MKRVVTLLIAAGLLMGAAAPKAEAVDVKFSGHYEAVGRYVDNYNFVQSGEGQNLAAPMKFDQRFRVNMNFIASESLSAFVRMQTAGANTTWGSATSTDAFVVSQAYMTWLVPNTEVQVRMGIVDDEFMTYALPTSLSGDGTAGVRVTAPINDNVSVIAGWHRPIYVAQTAGAHASSLDVFSLQVPLKFSSFAITPSVRYALIGENIPYSAVTNPNAGISATSLGGALFPVAFSDSQGSTIAQKRDNSSAWWAGFTSQYTGWAPFTASLDFYYGMQNSKATNIPYIGDKIMDRKGWLAALKLDYAFDFGKLGFISWYSTGDDRNPYDGSERMPSMGAAFNIASRVAAGAQDLVFAGTNTIGTAANAYGTASGTWGAALGFSGFSFFEGLTHGLWVEYVGGTNSHQLVRDYCPTVTPNRYLTTKDSIVEFGLLNTYKIYKDLTLRVQLAYAIENFSKKTWIDSGVLPAATKWGNIFETEVKLTYTF